MIGRLSPARQLRLCLKELRESLRDRRTIVTLVLMPLLVYPLLSLVLNRVLVTGVSAKAQDAIRIGVSKELKDSHIDRILVVGYTLLKEPEAAPLYLEEVVADRKQRQYISEDARDALPIPELGYLADDGRAALRNGSVDIVITSKFPNALDEDLPEVLGDGTEEVADDDSTAAEKPDAETEMEQLYSFMENPSDAEAAGAKYFSRIVGKYSIRYRQGDLQSERALQIVERMLAAVNNAVNSKMLSSEAAAPFRLVATPVQMQTDYGGLLATMIPLVLVLMTMAGAVYPAIDLTAGERERGTMEALIVSPTPNGALLLAKYSAVVTVALLTALANLGAMTTTLWVSGIGRMIFGENTLSVGVVGVILVLLVLFTMFFAALLLAVTSFAKSFKEAQAYLIPLMLLALTPGVMSLLPGIEFSPMLATVPLVNIVLLAREVLTGTAEWNTALVAVICNTVYAITALAVAARWFGSDASMQGSKGSWKDLLLRASEARLRPSVDQMAMTMALMFPLYFILSSTMPNWSEVLQTKLLYSAAVSYVLLLGTPLIAAWYCRVDFKLTFLFQPTRLAKAASWIPGLLLIGFSAWIFSFEIQRLGEQLQLATISDEVLKQFEETQEQLKALPLILILFAQAFTPAVTEEFLFRGFVLSSLRRFSTLWAVVVSAVIFGLMHVLTSNVLAVERFLPTTFMGLILGWIAIRTGSLWPGILVHACFNGLLLSLGYFEERLLEAQILTEESEHFPVSWLVGGGIALVTGLVLTWVLTRKPRVTYEPQTGELSPEA